MSGNIHRIPGSAISSTPLGATLKRFHQGKERVTDYLDKWKKRSLIPRLRSLDTEWNKTVVGLLGDLYNFYSLYNIDIERSFDSKKVFANLEDSTVWNQHFNRPSLIEEELFDLYISKSKLQDSYDVLNVQSSSINNFTPAANLLGMKDTPNSYTGEAGNFLGVDFNGTSISFLKPRSQATLLSLTNGPGSYPTLDSVLTSSSTSVSTKDYFDSKSYRLNYITYSGLVDTFNLSGTDCDNVLHLVDIGNMASNTSFHVLLGTSYEGARVTFKITAGENLNNNKYIHADTGAGVTLMNATPPDRYQTVPPYALTFVYSTQTQSYYLTEKFEAF